MPQFRTSGGSGFLIRLSISPVLLALVLCTLPSFAQERLRLATTTSVQDTGLLPHLLSHFERRWGCKVDVIAVGTGQALKIASSGDVDMVLVHDPVSEQKFLDDGFGINRKTFMVNDFVILGPSSDPARIRNMKDAARAFSAIQHSGAFFISRGDGSGTNQKERSLWKKSGANPQGSWYLETGQAMGAVLTMANEKEAYTLSDRASYLARGNSLHLQVLVEGDPDLINTYSAIQVNPRHLPSINAVLAEKLVAWLCSPEGQRLIGSYRVNEHQLFRPACGQ